MDDEDLMREALGALWDDASAPAPKLEAAVRNRDPEQCARLAHCSKGACANAGASAAPRVFRRIEQDARAAEFSRCEESLAALGAALLELHALRRSGRSEARHLTDES
jgi:HPt (histidine-containing phosphotransfer) domain-containing protein